MASLASSASPTSTGITLISARSKACTTLSICAIVILLKRMMPKVPADGPCRQHTQIRPQMRPIRAFAGTPGARHSSRSRSPCSRRDSTMAQTASRKKGSDLLVAALENEGVERIFGIPGEENLDVVESLRGSRIELVLTRHEQAAAFMAATYGRLTGKPGVCITTLGPGALNLTTGAAYALLGAMPMIMITGQKGILSSRQAGFQIVDIVATMKPLTKLARQIVSPMM